MKSSFFGSLLDVIPFATYAVDIENYQVVYINKILNDRIYAPEEKLCWKKTVISLFTGKIMHGRRHGWKHGCPKVQKLCVRRYWGMGN
jgi:hypothetical protein